MSVATFWPMLKKELYEQYRTYRVLIALVIFLLLGISAPIVTSLTPDLLKSLGNGIQITLPPQTATDALQSYIKQMSQLPALMLILLAMGSVADERGRGTAVTVLTKPLPRSVFVLAKFLAYVLTLFVSMLLAAVGAYYYTNQLFSAPPLTGFLLINLALFAFLTLILALTVLASVLFRNTVAAGGLAFGGFLVLAILPELNGTIAQALPSALFNPERVTQLLAGTAPLGDTLRPIFIGFGLALGLIALACIVFQYQEI
ncbi:MAG: ABC transporter permease subunit [Ktedonobacteraceae bacterium]